MNSRTPKSLVSLVRALAVTLITAGSVASAQAQLPDPTNCPIDHVVVVMMENRSFDHLLGWMTNASGRQAGLIYSNNAGQAFSTYPLAPEGKRVCSWRQ